MRSVDASISNGSSNGHAVDQNYTTSATRSRLEATLPTNNPIVLHLGDPIRHNLSIYARLQSQFHIIRPSPADLARPAFIRHLKDRTWGDFSAIMKPFWSTGGEMGGWDEELIDCLPPSVQIMASAGAGFDWVKTDLLAERGIIYCNGLGASTESVADTALYHIISVFRHMTWSALAARSNSSQNFEDAHVNVPQESHNPRGHVLGIVGLGNIGFAIAKKVRVAFGMRVAYFDLQRKNRQLEEEVDAEYYDTLEGLLPASDCVLLATPWGPPILTHTTLHLLRPGARVVNIARGNLIDENALVNALDSGHVAAAGLDVHAHEPVVDPRLVAMRNVTLTCHTGGGSVDTMIGFERLAMENVEAVLSGREPATAVNLHLLRRRVSMSTSMQHGEEKKKEEGEEDNGVLRADEPHLSPKGNEISPSTFQSMADTRGGT